MYSIPFNYLTGKMQLSRETCRLFVALLPPQPIQDQVKAMQQEVADRYGSRAALRSPPHITLQPPFEWPSTELFGISEALTAFASQHRPLTLTLSGFRAFAPRVIFVDVVRSPDLLNLHSALLAHIEQALGVVDVIGKRRPFAPHMTIGFRDLTRHNFRLAWPEFQLRPFYAEFLADSLTLLRHNGQRWNVDQQFILGDNPQG